MKKETLGCGAEGGLQVWGREVGREMLGAPKEFGVCAPLAWSGTVLSLLLRLRC